MLLVVVGHLESRASNPDIAAVARQKGRRKNRCCNREFGRARTHDDTLRSVRDFVHLATQTTHSLNNFSPKFVTGLVDGVAPINVKPTVVFKAHRRFVGRCDVGTHGKNMTILGSLINIFIVSTLFGFNIWNFMETSIFFAISTLKSIIVSLPT